MNSRWSAFIRRWLPVAGGAAIVLLLGCFSLESFLFEPTKIDGPYLQPADMDSVWHVRFIIPNSLIEPVTLTSQGRNIYGFFVRSGGQDSINRTVTFIYHHGTGENINRYWGRLELLWEMGYNIFIYDYQGYGMSEGTPSGDACFSDARQALEYCLSRTDVDSTRIVQYGFSLGSYMATYLAADIRHPLALILESGVASVSSLTREGTVLDIPGRYVADADFDNEKRIGRIDASLLLLHGKKDETAKFERNALVLYEKCDKSRTEYCWLDEGIHDNLPELMGSGYGAVIEEFVRKAVNGEP
jgi:esterase/lipase